MSNLFGSFSKDTFSQQPIFYWVVVVFSRETFLSNCKIGPFGKCTFILFIISSAQRSAVCVVASGYGITASLQCRGAIISLPGRWLRKQCAAR